MILASKLNDCKYSQQKRKNVLGNLRLEALFSKHTVYCGEVSLDSLGFLNFFFKERLSSHVILLAKKNFEKLFSAFLKNTSDNREPPLTMPLLLL